MRAFSILEVVAGNPAGISLADLSRSVGLHKSTAFRMLRTMAALGYVEQTEDSKLYCLGDRLSDAGFRQNTKAPAISTGR